jgi:hypothetical protein
MGAYDALAMAPLTAATIVAQTPLPQRVALTAVTIGVTHEGGIRPDSRAGQCLNRIAGRDRAPLRVPASVPAIVAG